MISNNITVLFEQPYLIDNLYDNHNLQIKSMYFYENQSNIKKVKDNVSMRENFYYKCCQIYVQISLLYVMLVLFNL